MSNHYDFVEEGYKIFGLYGADKKGNCECEREDCEAAYKHPRSSNWQNTPDWSDEQLETMEELGHFATGYGVLVTGLLVVDVDARNGGVDSFHKLCKDLDCDLLSEAGLAVSTGSGNGSMHLYFKNDTGAALKQHHERYEGIDFKSSGFVVGPSSLHKSGLTYEVMHGTPSDIAEPPAKLLDTLKKPDSYRAHTSRGVIDMTQQQCRDILSYISPDTDYDTWIRCGMAIHHTFDGDGLDIWDEWSAKGEKYGGFYVIQRHWHSFGKCSNPVQMGTLIHYAEDGGYKQPVEFEYVDDTQGGSAPIVDLKRPPGLVGEIAQWINNSARYKRENLAVAAALQAVGNIAGLKYIDARDGMTANMISFCVAGSSTGKEHIQQCFADCLRAAHLIDAMHGGIKSEQEIVRNLTRHQAAFYNIDELGLVLRKIMNSRNASYLEGVIGLIMSGYSKADSFLPVSGDVKEALRIELQNELTACQKRIDENEDSTGVAERRMPQIQRALNNIASGIEAPFLSVIGYTTPVTFNSLIDFETATNGFLSRAMIFDEPETNPKPNKKRTTRKIPAHLEAQLGQLYAMGEFDVLGDSRIENYADKKEIETMEDANERLDEIVDEFWQMAEDAKDSGLEAIPRRGYELCAKVSFVLSVSEGVRTLEHVEWAYALAKADCERKMRLALSNITKEEAPNDSIAVKIQDILQNSEDGETEGVIINRCRPHKKEEVKNVLAKIIEKGLIKTIEVEHPKNKKRFKRYVIS
ncbi:MAG: PriCT-2 domain-containing protein [Glaciecola sp.]